MSAGDNSNFDDNFKLNLQEQFGRSTVNSGKFSSYMAGNGNGGVGTLGTGGSAGPSTSAASVGLLTNNTNNGNGNNSDTKPSTSKSSNGNMTLTKYNSSGKLPSNEDIMRLSTALVTEK